MICYRKIAKNSTLKTLKIKKMTIKIVKTLECSQVLNLMDRDYSYQEALAIVLKSSSIDKKSLEEELNLHI